MIRRLAGAVLGALLLAGCSTVPSSSPTVQITQAPVRAPEAVGLEPLEPEEGAAPEEVVRGFISAAASTVRTHPVARQYLTAAAEESWSDDSGITVIAPDYATVTQSAGTVAVSAAPVGTVDQRGVFTVADPEAPVTWSFVLEEVGGEWRITNPPPGLWMAQQDFERLYDQRAVYFVDPTLQRVVPDLRYLVEGDSQPTALVERLLAGPSPSLGPGVENLLAGASLVRSVSAEGQSVTVDLSGVADLAPPQLSVLCAQVVWTLHQLPGAPSVQLLVDGEPLVLDGVPVLQSVEDWSAFDPEAAPLDAIGHYVQAGALRLADGSPAPGPAGGGAYGLASAAVSADARTGELSSMVGATGDGTLLLGPYGGDLTPALPPGGPLTTPTVAATRSEFWTVRDGTEIVRVKAGETPQTVSAPSLQALGRASVLQLSPDGVRAAVVVDGRLHVGTVARDEDAPVTLRDLRPVAPALGGVGDVAWSAADRLLVLAAEGPDGGGIPYSVGVDGWDLAAVSTAGLPGEPRSIAAAPSQQPLVSAGGSMWQLSGGTWLTLLRGQPAVLGTEPFFPV